MKRSVRKLQLKFWLLAMDAVALCGGFGSNAYHFAIRRAALCIDTDDIPTRIEGDDLQW